MELFIIKFNSYCCGDNSAPYIFPYYLGVTKTFDLTSVVGDSYDSE